MSPPRLDATERRRLLLLRIQLRRLAVYMATGIDLSKRR
jgi:hypothetical protein